MVDAIEMSFMKKKNVPNKHSKLGEGWEEHRDPYKQGVQFLLKYLGSSLVDEIKSGETYADGRSTDAIRTIVQLNAKSGKKHHLKVILDVTSKGIKITDAKTKEEILSTSIDRISFCTHDRGFNKIFAYMGRNDINETVECHAFECPKPSIAKDVCLSVNQSFLLAKDELDAQQNQRKFSHGDYQPEFSPAMPSVTDGQPPTQENREISESRRKQWVSFEEEEEENIPRTNPFTHSN